MDLPDVNTNPADSNSVTSLYSFSRAKCRCLGPMNAGSAYLNSFNASQMQTRVCFATIVVLVVVFIWPVLGDNKTESVNTGSVPPQQPPPPPPRVQSDNKPLITIDVENNMATATAAGMRGMRMNLKNDDDEQVEFKWRQATTKIPKRVINNVMNGEVEEVYGYLASRGYWKKDKTNLEDQRRKATALLNYAQGPNMLTMLLDFGAVLDHTHLIHYIATDKFKMMYIATNNGLDLDEHNGEAIKLACYKNSAKMVQLLLSRGAKPQKECCGWARFYHNHELAEFCV